MSKAWQHFCTITKHRHLVMLNCFKVGLYKQGLLHDLSKYTPTEFKVGAKYYQGDRSPNNAEREDKGLSTSWLHHKGRNKHHYEYWVDYGLHSTSKQLIGMKMPDNYIVEMFMDRIAASKVYKGSAYKDSDPLDYYKRGKGDYIMHPHTKELLERLLVMLAEKGERKTFYYIRKHVLNNR